MVISVLYMQTLSLRESFQIRSNFWSVFSPNAGKYGPEITPFLDTFHAVCCRVPVNTFFRFLLIFFNKQYYKPWDLVNSLQLILGEEYLNQTLALGNLRSKNHCKKMKFSIKDFFSKCDQIHRKLQIWSHWLKKFVMENFIFCAVNSWVFVPSSEYLSNSMLRWIKRFQQSTEKLKLWQQVLMENWTSQ